MRGGARDLTDAQAEAYVRDAAERLRDLAERPLPPVRPGDLLRSLMRVRDIKQADLAYIMGRPTQVISELVNHRKRFTTETSMQLEEALLVPARVWLVLQMEEDLRAARPVK